VRERLGFIFAPTPRLDLVSLMIQDASSFCLFRPSQSPREPSQGAA
jgi:hypothetical protein